MEENLMKKMLVILLAALMLVLSVTASAERSLESVCPCGPEETASCSTPRRDTSTRGSLPLNKDL